MPPEPGPLPVPAPDRGIAWIGVFGAPVVLLVSLLAGIDLPRWVGWLMVAWFVGGFVYLVHQMPREPRDPWDDGSRTGGPGRAGSAARTRVPAQALAHQVGGADHPGLGAVARPQQRRHDPVLRADQ